MNFFLLGTLRPTAKVVGNTLQHVFMAMEYVEHELKVLLVQHAFAVAEQKCLLRQLLAGVAHLHLNWTGTRRGARLGQTVGWESGVLMSFSSLNGFPFYFGELSIRDNSHLGTFLLSLRIVFDHRPHRSSRRRSFGRSTARIVHRDLKTSNILLDRRRVELSARRAGHVFFHKK